MSARRNMLLMIPLFVSPSPGMRFTDIRDQGGMTNGALQIDVAWERTARAWDLLLKVLRPPD